eukprot:Sspe_Gene.95831::Locus_68138_Transcript_1_1_Confidence_1.000_Length_385::g.95831::m.95831
MPTPYDKRPEADMRNTEIRQLCSPQKKEATTKVAHQYVCVSMPVDLFLFFKKALPKDIHPPPPPLTTMGASTDLSCAAAVAKVLVTLTMKARNKCHRSVYDAA